MADHIGRQSTGTTRPTDGTARAARRRRRRSVRALAASVLLGLAASGVGVAVVIGSRTGLAVVGVAAVLLGCAAARIVWSEVLVARRDAAADRSKQAEAYVALARRRSAAHTQVVTGLGARLDRSRAVVERLDRDLASTRVALHHAEQRAREAREQARQDARSHRRQAEELRAEVALLQQALADEPDATGHGTAVVAMTGWQERRPA